MPWGRNSQPDPLEARRRQLAEQERLLSEQRRKLTEQLSGEMPEAVKPAEPPVWRLEDEDDGPPQSELTPARKRNLARQRQNDMILFFVCIGVFLIVLGIVLWVAYVHNNLPANRA